MSLFGLFACLYGKAQADTFYFDKNNRVAEPIAANHYRVILPGDTVRQICDYYLNGKTKEITTYTSRDAVVRDGYCMSFYPDGKRNEQGKYKKGFRDSVWMFYAITGKLRERRTYNAPDAGFDLQIFDTLNGHLRCIGSISNEAQREGKWVDYFLDSDSIQFIRSFKQGFRDGEQFEYYRNGRLKRQETIVKYKVKKGKMYDSLGKATHYYPAVEYPVSKTSAPKFLRQKVPCLDSALQLSDLTAKLHVTANGHIDGVNWEGELTDECRQSLTDQLYRMKKWKPGRRENVKTAMWVEIHLRKYVLKE